MEFTVTPASGELTPAGAEGTLIRVAYKPQIYGKTHKAKLVVQVRALFPDPRRLAGLRLHAEKACQVCCSVVVICYLTIGFLSLVNHNFKFVWKTEKLN